MDYGQLLQDAELAEKEHRWPDACACFLELAHRHRDAKKYDNAATYFMRAATAGERSQDWRMLGQVWTQCAAALRSRTHGAVADLEDASDSTRHFFPTLDHFAWPAFAPAERLGRAYRNAAYHLERSGSNQTAYIQYRLSAEAFRAGNLPDEASRSYWHGLMSFVDRHGELDPSLLDGLRDVSKALLQQDFRRFSDRVLLFYRRVAGALLLQGNTGDASRVSALESSLRQEKYWRERRIGPWLVHAIWGLSSAYGTNLTLWSLWATGIFAIVFPIAYMNTDSLVWLDKGHPSVVDYLFFSLAAITTSPDPSFGLTTEGKIMVMIEALLGVVLLGSFVSLLAKRFLR